MTPLVRRRLYVLAGPLAAAAAVECLLVAGSPLGLPTPVLTGGRVLLVLLMAVTASLVMALWTAMNRSFTAIAAALENAASPDSFAAAPGSGGPGPDPRSVGPDIAESLSTITERIATLQRQRDEQKLAARLAQKRSRHLEAVLRGLPDAALVTDAMDRVVMFNPAAARLLRLPADPEPSVRPLGECIADRELCDLLHGAHALPACKEVEHSVAGDGGKRIFSVRIAPFGEAPQESARGAVTVIHEVTRERTADRMKTEFVAKASHELRTPLGGIRAYLEMLMDGEVKEEKTRDQFYQVMQGEVERLSNLVDNILNIARIEAGIVKVSKENVPLAAIVQEVADAMRPQAAATGITLGAEVLPVFFHVYADREMMRRAVVNLISNAVKYTPQGGTVSVKMRVDEAAGEVSVDVSDTGVGIGEQDLPKLFQKFFRVESSRKMAKGTGLGLVLVKEVIEGLHGGRVSVKSELGKGSTFSLTLPLVREKQAAEA